MSRQWAMIQMEVPVDQIDFSECGDGCGTVGGLAYARFKGCPIYKVQEQDRKTVEAAMYNWLGEELPEDVAGAKRALELAAAEHRRRMEEIAASAHQEYFNDPLTKRRA